MTDREMLEMLVEGQKQIFLRLDGVDSRLDGIDNRLDGIDNRLDGIDVRLDQKSSGYTGGTSEIAGEEV